jgi:hypothetical protein
MPQQIELGVARRVRWRQSSGRGTSALSIPGAGQRPFRSWGSETRTSCRDLVVLVNETAESVPAPDAGGDCYRIRPSPNLDTSGRPKREASVRPLTVVVPQVLVEHPLKMTPTPDQHPIQTLLPHRRHPALGERAGVRRLHRGLDELDALSGEDVVEARGNLASRSQSRNRGRSCPPAVPLSRAFPCPPDDPSPVRMVGDVRDPDLPRVQLDEEQDVAGLAAHGLHREDVGRDAAGGLGPKERSPGDQGSSGRGPTPIAEQHRADRVADTRMPSLLSSPWMRWQPSAGSPWPAAGSAQPAGHPAADDRLEGRLGPLAA